MEQCKITAIANQKGGVGKTVTTFNLGVGLARAGQRVLMVDADPQGSLTISMGIKTPDDLDMTITSLMQATVDDRLPPDGFGIIHSEEGVDLIPGKERSHWTAVRCRRYSGGSFHPGICRLRCTMMRVNGDTLIIGVDAGYGNMKTVSCVFPTGLSAFNEKPFFTENLLVFHGKYYLIGSGHKEFTDRKIMDEDYYVMTPAAAARELATQGIKKAKVILAVGFQGFFVRAHP